jgi:hypothetical protein
MTKGIRIPPPVFGTSPGSLQSHWFSEFLICRPGGGHVLYSAGGPLLQVLRNLSRTSLAVLILLASLTCGCAKRKPEDPFSYPFVRQLQIKRQSDQPYSDYKAFYVLTEDFEPLTGSTTDVDQIREAIAFASNLSSTYGIPWTHFVDANTLAPAYVSADPEIKQRCQAMVSDLKQLVKGGDDCELHFHGQIDARLLDLLRSQNKLHIKSIGVESTDYRQRRSFFFRSFYYEGYRGMVATLSYGKMFLEQAIYDGQEQVLAFRPGGWDHGASSQDTRLYFSALSDAGLIANSGLSFGDFGTPDFGVGNSPGGNVATVTVGDKSITELSPTRAPGDYVNPVLFQHLDRLVGGSAAGSMPVIMSVYHLGGLQQTRFEQGEVRQEETEQFNADLEKSREALQRHFQEMADLRSKKVFYPITLRKLLSIIRQQ